jgi:hypothetical protein
MPARYEFTVLAFTLHTLTSQSMKIKIFLWLNGLDRSSLVSILHFSTMVLAVLYVLQVLLVMPMLPKSAKVLAASFGNSSPAKSSAAQPPFVPYFWLPLTGVGQKLFPCPNMRAKINYETPAALCHRY